MENDGTTQIEPWKEAYKVCFFVLCIDQHSTFSFVFDGLFYKLWNLEKHEAFYVFRPSSYHLWNLTQSANLTQIPVILNTIESICRWHNTIEHFGSVLFVNFCILGPGGKSLIGHDCWWRQMLNL